MKTNLDRRIAAEFLGTAMLLAGIVGSGIMGEQLSGGNVAVALLANSLATGAILVAVILTFGQISGAHFNPAVTLSNALMGEIKWRDVLPYITAQTLGAIAGVALADVMFDLPVFFASQKARTGGGQFLSEFIATFGLSAVIWGCVRLRRQGAIILPLAVAAYISSAYWFTASTGFANPAVTLARSMSDTFTGIRLIDAPSFIAAQLLGALTSTLIFRWLIPQIKEEVKSSAFVIN